MAKHPLKKDELLEAFTMQCSPDNTIPLSRLGAVIRSLGRAPTEAQLQTLIKEFESKGVQTLTCQQVEAIINKYDFPPESPEALRDALRLFDKEGTGMISVPEVQHILCSLAEKLMPEECAELIRELDPNCYGQMSIDEFVRVIESGL